MIAGVLFETVVVVVTLTGTLGTWRIYKRSVWKGLTLTHLLAEQSMWLFCCRIILRFRYQVS